MNPRAQVSIEFLLVFTALLVFLSVFIGAFSGLNVASDLALDAQSARRFSSGIEQSSAVLSLLGDGSEKFFDADILTEWVFAQDSGNFFLVAGTDSAFVKIPVLGVDSVPLGKTFSGKVVFVLARRGDSIVLENR